MLPGYIITELASLLQAANRFVQNARAAGTKYSELCQEAKTLKGIVKNMNDVLSRPHSLLNKESSGMRRQLESIIRNCQADLDEICEALENCERGLDNKSSLHKWVERAKIGNVTVPRIKKIQVRAVGHQNAISWFLNTLQVGSLGRIEEALLDEFAEMKIRVDWITARWVANSMGEQSEWSSISRETKNFWKSLGKRVHKMGIDKRLLEKNKKTILDYLQEKSGRGILDDGPVDVEPGTESGTPTDDREEDESSSTTTTERSSSSSFEESTRNIYYDVKQSDHNSVSNMEEDPKEDLVDSGEKHCDEIGYAEVKHINIAENLANNPIIPAAILGNRRAKVDVKEVLADHETVLELPRYFPGTPELELSIDEASYSSLSTSMRSDKSFDGEWCQLLLEKMRNPIDFEELETVLKEHGVPKKHLPFWMIIFSRKARDEFSYGDDCPAAGVIVMEGGDESMWYTYKEDVEEWVSRKYHPYNDELELFRQWPRCMEEYSPPATKPQLVGMNGGTIFIRVFGVYKDFPTSDPGGLRALIKSYKFQKLEGIAEGRRQPYWEVFSRGLDDLESI